MGARAKQGQNSSVAVVRTNVREWAGCGVLDCGRDFGFVENHGTRDESHGVAASCLVVGGALEALAKARAACPACHSSTTACQQV